MYRSLSVAVLLLAAFAFTSGTKPVGASPASPTSPLLVAKGKLVYQTGPVPTTTIFTPTLTGLYRLSVYGMTVTPCTSSDCTTWTYDLYWTDDAGGEASSGLILHWHNGKAPAAYAENLAAYPGTVLTFEAVSGNPVAYAVTGGVADGGAYSLYYTIEQLQ